MFLLSFFTNIKKNAFDEAFTLYNQGIQLLLNNNTNTNTNAQRISSSNESTTTTAAAGAGSSTQHHEKSSILRSSGYRGDETTTPDEEEEEEEEGETTANSRRSSSVFMFSDNDSGFKSPQSSGATGAAATASSFLAGFVEPKRLVVDLDTNNNNSNSAACGSGGGGEATLRLERNEQSIVDMDELKSFMSQSNAAATGYCVDSVEPKCSELKRLIDEFKAGYLSKLNRFKNNKIILQRLNNVRERERGFIKLIF